jgi:accessory gene regulator protein AgrB
VVLDSNPPSADIYLRSFLNSVSLLPIRYKIDMTGRCDGFKVNIKSGLPSVRVLVELVSLLIIVSVPWLGVSVQNM